MLDKHSAYPHAFGLGYNGVGGFGFSYAGEKIAREIEVQIGTVLRKVKDLAGNWWISDGA